MREVQLRRRSREIHKNLRSKNLRFFKVSRCPGGSRGHPGGSWGPLGGVWGRLGGVLGRLGGGEWVRGEMDGCERGAAPAEASASYAEGGEVGAWARRHELFVAWHLECDLGSKLVVKAGRPPARRGKFPVGAFHGLRKCHGDFTRGSVLLDEQCDRCQLHERRVLYD